MRLTIGLLLGASAFAQVPAPTIVWTHKAWGGGGTGWNNIRKDPVGGGMLLMTGVSGSSTIYATNIYSWNLNNTTTNIDGTGLMARSCEADTATRPGSRHPVGQAAVDSRRGIYWIWEGVLTDCSQYLISVSGSAATYSGASTFATDGSWPGAQVYIPTSTNCPTAGSPCTIASVASTTSMTFTSPPGGTLTNAAMYFVDKGNGTTLGIRQDMYGLSLNATPASNIWTRYYPATQNGVKGLPTDISGGGVGYQGTGTYISTDDCLYHFEGARVYRYCSTIGNPGGTLTADQAAAGATLADTWTQVSSTAPTDVYPGLATDPSRGLIWVYSGSNGGTSIYAYNPGGVTRFGVASHTFKQLCTASACTATAPPAGFANNCPGGCNWAALAFNSQRNTVWFHHTVNSDGTTGNPGDYEFDPSAGTDGMWTTIQTGSGPVGNNGSAKGGVTMDYDTTTNSLVTYGIDGIWQGQISTSTPTVSIPLTLQEAVFPGSLTSGIARTNEPWCMGVPVADSVALTDTSTLALSGITSMQFRILGKWPSGNIKWLKACGILPSLTAGGAATTTLANNSASNTACGTTSLPNGSDATCYGAGGSNMAVDNGATITVTTGAATFTIKKANFNGIDIADVGATHVLMTSSAATRGLVLTGPDPTSGTVTGKVTCTPETGGSACATIYSSANDSASTCVIEENGPVLAVLRCTGTHKDAGGNPYLQFTAREYFYQGKANVKATVTLRNANWDTSASPSPDCNYSGSCLGGSFNNAAKGIKAYEFRLSPNISGALNYSIATDVMPQTGTLNGTSDTAYIYQGTSNWMVPTAAPDNNYCGPATACANTYTTDTGYIAKKNTTTLASGDVTKTIQGWADISDSSGVGLSIGIDQMAAMWPGSLEFQGGGGDARIGLLSGQNSKNVYMPWPMWKTFETYMTFHATTPASLSDEFFKQQHFLVARPSTTTYINSTGVFPYPIPDAATEDAYYVSTQTAANPAQTLQNYCFNNNTTACTPDRGMLNTHGELGKGFAVGVYRYYAWGQGGSLNQGDFRWGDDLKFLQRGFTGRFLNSKYFYRYLAELHWAHADGTSSTDSTVNGFTWRGRPLNTEVNNVTGSPKAVSSTAEINQIRAFGMQLSGPPQWQDYLHEHTGGIYDHYMLTGDEAIKEGVVPNKDYYLNTNTSAYGVSLTNTVGITRGYGVWMMYAARYADYLASIGDSVASASALAAATHQFDTYVNVQSCEGGIRPGQTAMTYYPAGCSVANRDTGNEGGGRSVGTISASGTTASWISGTSQFSTTGWVVGAPVVFNGVTYTIASIIDATHLTTTATITGCPTSCAYAYGGSSGWLAGMSLERGGHQSNVIQTWCATNTGTDSGMLGNYRVHQNFQQSILIEGLLSLRRSKGVTWTNYNRALDLAYGLAQNNLLESYADDGTSLWSNGSFSNGMNYVSLVDYPAACPAGTANTDGLLIGPSGGKYYDAVGLPQGSQGVYFSFYAWNLLNGGLNGGGLQRKLNIAIQRGSTATSAWLGDWGMYSISNLIYSASHPPAGVMQGISPTSVVESPPGTYAVTFTTPAGTCTNDPSCLRVKWSTKIIRPHTELLGFDALTTQMFTYDPNIYATWFGSNNVWPEPTPTPGTPQTYTLVTAPTTTGLTASNIYVSGIFPPGTDTSAASVVKGGRFTGVRK